jgi:hypothetical protein
MVVLTEKINRKKRKENKNHFQYIVSMYVMINSRHIKMIYHNTYSLMC